MSELGIIEKIRQDREGATSQNITIEEFLGGLKFNSTWDTITAYADYAGPLGAGINALNSQSGVTVPKQEDYNYFFANFRYFSPKDKIAIPSMWLGLIKNKLINKEEVTDSEKSFYKTVFERIKTEEKNNPDFNDFAKAINILNWLFALRGIVDVQTGATTILEMFNKNSMISAISKEVDLLLKGGFNIRSSGRRITAFSQAGLPVVNKLRIEMSDRGYAFEYPQLRFRSKISSDDLEETAEFIQQIISQQNSGTPGMAKYANIIAEDVFNNIYSKPYLSGKGYWFPYLRVNYTYKYNGKDVTPDYDGWEDESGKWPDREADIEKFIRQIQEDDYIKVSKGLGNTSVVNFGNDFGPSVVTNDTISGLQGLPKTGRPMGEVISSLLDTAYAFYVTEVGSTAFNNPSVDQRTLFEESVYYYSDVISRIIAIAINNISKFYLFAEASALFAQGEDITDEKFDEAKTRANEVANQAAADIGGGGGLDATEQLTEEQIKNRQRFVKQCILMYNLETLQAEYRSYIKDMPLKDPNHKIHGVKPFAGRFYPIQDTESNNTNTINKMIIPKGKTMKPLLEITPDIHAFLVPKIRLFRVTHRIDGVDKGLEEIEFDFKKSVNKKRVEDLINAQYDKGSSYGIKSFDFTFEGTNPATARNDIVADLSLYFQSFQDFLEEKTDSLGRKYRFVDLLIFPVNKKNRIGTGTLRAEEYDPSYYRIRAEVGWSVPEKHEALEEVLKKRGTSYEDLKKSLLLTNKSFYLNMVDHDLTIKDDGTLDIKISYRAYIESALKSTKFDALSGPTIRRNRQKFKEAMSKALENVNCSVEEIKVIKELFRKAEEETIKQLYRSILTRLNSTNSIFYVDANVQDIKRFRRDGFFSRGLAPRIQFAQGFDASQGVQGLIQSTIQIADRKALEETAEKEGVTLRILQDGVKDYPPEDVKEDNRINFFYLGDLIYTILDNIYDENTGEQNIDMNKTKLLLSSFGTFGAFGETDSSQFKTFNIVDIPVSVEYFYEWYTQNVIKPKRLYYPIMSFVRDLCNDLIVNLLLDSCSNRPIDTKMRFNTANFVLLGRDDGTDPFNDFIPDDGVVIDTSTYYGTGDLPLLSDKEGEKDIEDFYNYIAIYPITSTTVHPGRGNPFEDANRGIYHFVLGANKGLLKKCTFSKTDMQYVREARFFRSGFDGLMQLGAVYKASLTMVGNTIYYPGMDLYIDPVGVGGPDFKPNDKDSVAYKLGLGGYHLVTRVQSKIGPGKFETTVEAMWHNSGAGTGRFADRPEFDRQKDEEKENEDLSVKPKENEDGSLDFSTRCTPLVSSFEDYLVNIQSTSEPVEFNPDLSSFTVADTATIQGAAASEVFQDGGFNIGDTVGRRISNVPGTGEEQ